MCGDGGPACSAPALFTLRGGATGRRPGRAHALQSYSLMDGHASSFFEQASCRRRKEIFPSIARLHSRSAGREMLALFDPSKPDIAKTKPSSALRCELGRKSPLKLLPARTSAAESVALPRTHDHSRSGVCYTSSPANMIKYHACYAHF